MERWTVTPAEPPAVIRHCSQCGSDSRFLCSGRFRVNANGRNIDVWLIYNCARCGAAWKMEILSRVKPQQIEPPLYASFAANDRALAAKYAFDAGVLRRNRAAASYDGIPYKVEKEVADGEPDRLEIVADYDLPLRLDQLLSEQLLLSRAKIKSLFENGLISSGDPNVTGKTRVTGTIRLTIENGRSLTDKNEKN